MVPRDDRSLPKQNGKSCKSRCSTFVHKIDLISPLVSYLSNPDEYYLQCVYISKMYCKKKKKKGYYLALCSWFLWRAEALCSWFLWRGEKDTFVCPLPSNRPIIIFEVIWGSFNLKDKMEKGYLEPHRQNGGVVYYLKNNSLTYEWAGPSWKSLATFFFFF